MRIPWLLITLAAFACGEYRMDGPTESADGDATSKQTLADSGKNGGDDDSKAGAQEENKDRDQIATDSSGEGPNAGGDEARVESLRHKVFVPGWGPSSFSSLRPLMQKMAADGVPETHLHEIRYNSNGDLEPMSSEIAAGIRAVLDKLPAGERIDVFGYSLGTFTSVHAVLENGLKDRVAMMVSLAGVERGQHKKPPNCLFGCSDVYTLLVPFENERVRAFYDRHPEWKDVSKCAVHSPDDGSVDPHDSNRFPESKVVSVPGVGHLQMPKSAAIFQEIRKACYEGRWR